MAAAFEPCSDVAIHGYAGANLRSPNEANGQWCAGAAVASDHGAANVAGAFDRGAATCDGASEDGDAEVFGGAIAARLMVAQPREQVAESSEDITKSGRNSTTQVGVVSKRWVPGHAVVRGMTRSGGGTGGNSVTGTRGVG